MYMYKSPVEERPGDGGDDPSFSGQLPFRFLRGSFPPPDSPGDVISGGCHPRDLPRWVCRSPTRSPNPEGLGGRNPRRN